MIERTFETESGKIHYWEGLTVYWIPGAGHNSNTDKPEKVNKIIRDFTESIVKEQL